jgi:hypothetical protein
MIMTANVGVSLLTISQPDTYRDPELPRRVRDAVHAAVLAEPRTTGEPGAAAEPDAVDDRAETSRVAAGLAALLRRSPAGSLSEGEAALLQEWLARLSDNE